MAELGTIVAIASLAAGGVQYAGAQKQASAQQAAARHQRDLANINAGTAISNARSSYQAQMAAIQAQQAQNALQFRQAQINNIFAEREADVRQRNAQALRLQAAAVSEQGKEQIRRTRTDHERLKARQRARIAASGVTEQGSPVELLAETAGQMQLALDEQNYQRNVAVQELETRAEFEDYGAEMARVGNAFDLQFAETGFRVNELSSQVDELTAASQRDQAFAQANINQMVGRSNAQIGFANAAATRNQGLSNLFSSVGTATGQFYNYSQQTPRRSSTYSGYQAVS